MSHEIFDVVIVGGGPAGLSAAFELRDRKMMLLEATDRVGGRLYSVPRGDYWLNFGGHLLPGPGSRIRTMMESLGLDVIPIPGNKFGLHFGGKVYAPKISEALPFYLPMSLKERVALIVTGLRLKLAVAGWRRVIVPKMGETNAKRRARIANYLSTVSFRDVIKTPPERIDNIFKSAGRRAFAEPEQQTGGCGVSLFGFVWSKGDAALSVNINGGSGRLGVEMARLLGDRIHFEARVQSVEKDGEYTRVVYKQDHVEKTVLARQVIMAVPACIAATVVRDLPRDLKTMLEEVRYCEFPSMAILTNETKAMPWDKLYAITTPESSFDMLFNHSNPLRTGRVRKPGSSLMVYAGGEPAIQLMKLSDDEIKRRYLEDLYKIYPQLRDVIVETVLQRWTPGNTYRPPNFNFQPMLKYCERSDADVHFAGDYFSELQTMETAASTGFEAALKARGQLEKMAAVDKGQFTKAVS